MLESREYYGRMQNRDWEQKKMWEEAVLEFAQECEKGLHQESSVRVSHIY